MKKVIIYTYEDIKEIITKCTDEVKELELSIKSDEEYRKELIPEYLYYDAIKKVDKYIFDSKWRVKRLLKLITYLQQVLRHLAGSIWFNYDGEQYVILDVHQQREYNVLYDFSD